MEQQISENGRNRMVTSVYSTSVHVDEQDNMVIIKTTTLDSQPEKSNFQQKQMESEGTVDAETSVEITSSLETFFKLYPTAAEKERTYHVAENVLEPINGDYLYSELINPIFTQDGENVRVSVAVKFLGNQTKATQISQFGLVLIRIVTGRVLNK
ncbi:conjugal transfer protein [Enterococcus gallinarum]|uniref:conjugal transfer protein n=1 Tax=Enterococcus gallinarum TaxID=1353 RepID=UPI003FA5B9A6